MRNREKKPKGKLIRNILIIILALGLIGSFMPSDDDSKDVGKSTAQSEQTNSTEPKKEKNTTQTPEVESTVEDEALQEESIADDSEFSGESAEPFTVSMLDVGQGLSLLIGANGHYMLYDGGGRKSSSFVVSYLKKHNITDLDYIIASHYDEDHISGLNGVLATTPVETALLPDYSASTQTYESFIKRIKLTETPYKHPKVGQTYSLGNADFDIIGPDSYEHEDDNDSSIAIRFQYGSTSCIITGDTTESGEKKMLSADLVSSSDLYVVSHHGSASSSCDAFLKKVSPKYAFISVGKDNSYGHPSKRVLKSLKKYKVKMFRTDVQKTVTAISDGESWKFDKNACSDWSAGKTEKKVTPVSVNNNKKAKVTKSKTSTKKVSQRKKTKKKTRKKKKVLKYKYVINVHTGKFHYPNCYSVSRMNDSNKQTVKTTREDLINRGYSPCGNCHP